MSNFYEDIFVRGIRIEFDGYVCLLEMICGIWVLFIYFRNFGGDLVYVVSFDVFFWIVVIGGRNGRMVGDLFVLSLIVSILYFVFSDNDVELID